VVCRNPPAISTLVAAPLFRITVEPSWEHGLKRRSQVRFATSVALALVLTLSGCEYAKLLRPKALKQLNPEMVALVNELPELDNANEAIIGRLFPHGGLSRADLGRDGNFRDAVAVPENQYIWRPAIIVMQRPGRLELDFSNDDNVHHMAFLPSETERQVLDLPVHTRGRATLDFNHPGLYWFGCPVSNHAGRGMLGLIIVKGEMPAAAKLDRPRQKRPGE
jgi:PQQ system protein